MGEEEAMANRAATGQRLTSVFLLGCLLFTFPLLSIFNSADTFLGVPVLYAYLFVA